MKDFKLKPCDILINIDTSDDWLSRVERWLLESPFTHVFMYLGRVHIGPIGSVTFPMIFESSGRGCQLLSVYNHINEEVLVMRPYSHETQDEIIYQAVNLASDLQAYYDYYCIAKFVIPQAILRKLGLERFIPLAYQRDARMICSEACAEVFWRAGIDILPKDVIPLPGDFAYSPILELVKEGKLSEEWL
jgi:hypothetical protein